MKITPNILSIPPYISTTWKNISTLHVREEAGGALCLVAVLRNQIQVEIPGLEKGEIEVIFEAHAKYTAFADTPPKSPLEGFTFSLPLKNEGSLIDSLGPTMQHNADQADLPALPPDVLAKIATVARAFGLEDTSLLKDPEPSCNCIYCQIVRTLKGGEPEEEVADADLRFRTWDIAEKSNKLYLVTNPLDQNEHYNVFLGDPLGCTCGARNCEHIHAVLSS